MIDTHAHLDALEEPRAAIARAREAGVTRMITIGTGIESCRAALAIAEQHDGVYAALGIDPHRAADEEADGRPSCVNCSTMRRQSRSGRPGSTTTTAATGSLNSGGCSSTSSHSHERSGFRPLSTRERQTTTPQPSSAGTTAP